MDMLERLVGGPQQQGELQDFANRVQQGQHDQVSDQETVQRYQQVAPALTTDQYRDSAEEAFAKLSPDERAQFSEWLRTHAQQQGVTLPGHDLNDQSLDTRAQEDPAHLADVTAQLHQQQPNILEQLMGRGGTGGTFDNPIAKMAFAGIAAMAAQKLMGGRR
jgi:hypothetical protein